MIKAPVFLAADGTGIGVAVGTFTGMGVGVGALLLLLLSIVVVLILVVVLVVVVGRRKGTCKQMRDTKKRGNLYSNNSMLQEKGKSAQTHCNNVHIYEAVDE